MKLIVQPNSLWSPLTDPVSLVQAAAEFQRLFGEQLLDDERKLFFPIVKMDGKRFSRTHVQGIYIVKHTGHSFSLYEDRLRYEDRLHTEAWAEFAKGEWTNDVPKTAGLWPVLSREGFQGVHQFVQLPEGQGVQDVSGGYVTPGKVTTWKGRFWSKRMPSLRGAK